MWVLCVEPCDDRFSAVEADPVTGCLSLGPMLIAVSVLGFVGKPVLYSIVSLVGLHRFGEAYRG